MPLHAAHSLRNFLRLVDGELPQVTQPLLLLHSPRDHVVPPVDSERVLGRVSSTDVTEILLEQSHHVATLDHDADRIFEESHAFVTRLVTGPGAEHVTESGAAHVKESDAESVQQSDSGSAEQIGPGSLGQREGTATGG